MSPTPDSTLDDPQQIIAELQRQLAEAERRLNERTAERDEALEQQTATAEVLGVINSSPGELKPVFEAMIERAVRLCEADGGTLWMFDGEAFHPNVVTGSSLLVRDIQTARRPTTGTSLGRIFTGEDLVHELDVTESPAYRVDALGLERTRAAGARTTLAVALRKDGYLLGAITTGRRTVRAFSETQIALLKNFAAQAVIAMENARLITETREALEQQTATAEVLGVINSSPGDLAPVFDAILEKAHRLCGATNGALVVRDGENFRAVSTHGLPEGFAAMLTEPHPLPHGSPPERLLQGERLVHILDQADHEQDNPIGRAAVQIAGTRTILMIPLRRDDAFLGYISAFRQEVRPFSRKQIALLQNFAAQAVIAMENARLMTETREALEQQTATAEILGVINSSPGDLTPVFDAMLEKAHSLCGAELGRLFTYDGETFWPVAAHGVSARDAEWMREGFQPAQSNPFVRVIEGAPLVHIADIRQVAEFRTIGLRTAVEHGLRTFLIMPLRKDDALLGVITAVRREVRPFTEKQIALLQNFAAQAVIAMENARLITETREALEQQTATAEVLGVINSSPGDLALVFEAILEKAHTLCGAAFGGLLIYDGDRFKAVALHNVPPAFAEIARQPFPPTRNNPVQRLLEGAPLVHIADLKEIVDADPDEPMPRAGVELGGIRTLLMVPLCKDKALLGIITAYRQEVRPFTDKQIALLENFAAQAVIAMENGRLLSELRQRTEEVGALNRDLEARVAAQVDELGRVGRLKRFLAPQLAELIVSHGDEKILESHRREIVVVFCDLRGYTAFTETAEPEEVLHFLREYHGALGPLVSQFEGTLDQFSGDGIMVFFNDPVPCPDPAERAVKMAVAMREAARELIAAWSRHGCELGFGAGIAQGFATLGQIGFSERSGYTAIGTVCNLAARLCAEAKDGQILISSRIAEAVEAVARLEDLGNLELKGLRRPVAAFNVAQSTSPAEARPNLTVVARDTGA